MNEIEQLIEKYLDGDTTHAEELQLRQYFARQQEIPEEWKAFSALFSYIDEKEQPRRRTVYLSHHSLWWTAVAAVVVGMVTLVIAWPKGDQAYAVINGQRTTDTEVIMREAELALQMVASDDNETFDALQFMN